MTHFRNASLNTLLAIDAVTCAAMGAALLLGSARIGSITNIPAGLLFWAGASLLPIAAFMAACSRTSPIPVWAAMALVLGNLVWATASIALPATGLISPSPIGWAFLIGQAGFVVLLAKLEFDAVQRQSIVQ